MEVVSACPLPVGSILWRTWSGAIVLTVVCKATFRLQSIESPLASEQEPILDADRYWHDDPRQGLRAPSDLVPFKRRADIVVVGHAYAPYGTPVRSLVARLLIAGADKTVEIFTDRVFTFEGSLREGKPFAKSPLHWMYAAGGPGTWNPVGIRQDGPRDPYGQLLLPRFQPPVLQIKSPSDVIPTIGFGPIAPTWPERVAKLHHHAQGWDHQRWHLGPLPRDIDVAYFNAAPADQQVDAIRADERIILENLHPLHTRLVTNLAAATPEAVVERPGQPAEAVPFICDTMWIDTDRGVCALTWRARVLLDAPHAPGRVRVTLAYAGVVAAPIMEEASKPTAPPVQAAELASPPSPPAPTAEPAGPPAPPAPSHAGAGGAPAGTRAPSPPATPGSIAQCATIAASLARRPSDQAAILHDSQLSEDDWDALEQRWTQALRKEAERGLTVLLGEYDEAYVARLEEERGPITPEEYARLTLAHQRDRGAHTRALRDLGLPWGATPRIQRVFSERMAIDKALAERVRAALAEG